MDWLNKQLYLLAESITKLTPMDFMLKFTFGTFALAFVFANYLYNVLDAFDKAKALPDRPGILIICLFLALWVITMITTTTVIFALGGKLIRYDLPVDRLDSLKESGLISKTNKRIWLIGLSLHPFTSEGWLHIIKNKVKEGVSVRLLIFDPNSEFANERSSSFGGDSRTLSHDIFEAIDKFNTLKKDLGINHPTVAHNFEVHLYKGNASMSCFILDNEARVGVYVEGGTGLSAPELRVNKRNMDFFEIIEGNFIRIWDSSIDA